MTSINSIVRVAALADLHVGNAPGEARAALWEQLSASADVVALCGDLTDHGLPEEAQILAKELQLLRVPIVGVLGNHDYESGHEADVRAILMDAGMHLLDGDAWETQGVGFGGAKGFCGGFGRRTLEPWGERAIKLFVQEALDEALKLEKALSRLRTAHRIALLHYSPVQATVEGEPPEIYAFLGSSRLEEPLNRYEVAAVFHGHAHRGAPRGATASGIPVYNVSLPLGRRTTPERPFALLELPREGGSAKNAVEAGSTD